MANFNPFVMLITLTLISVSIVSSASVPVLPLKSLTPFMTMRQVVGVQSFSNMAQANERLSDLPVATLGQGGSGSGPVEPAPVLPPPGVQDPDLPQEGLRLPNSPRAPAKASPLPQKPATARRRVPNKQKRFRRGFNVRCFLSDRFRSIDGVCNNLFVPTLGAANTPFIVLSSRRRGIRRRFRRRPLPNARVVSNIVCAETRPKPNARKMSELVTFFGQFIDHVVTETATIGGNPKKIPIPADDPVFKPPQFIPFFPTVQVGRGRRRAPNNELSSYLDAAAVYGVEEKTVNALREKMGGRLLLPGGLLPKGTNGQFVAGDKRAAENPNLTSIHLLFAREHNAIAKEVSTAFPLYNDEQIFQLARHILIAKFQAIVYYEFIPALTGRPIRRYRGYKPWIPARISNRWSTVGFRVGHTMLNAKVTSITADAGFDNLVRGMISGRAAEIDNEITDEVRNNLFPISTTLEQLDLASLNIERGRDHNVPKCNDLRISLGLRPFRSFLAMAGGNFVVANKLRKAYGGRINIVDPWVCGISERKRRGSSLGALFNKIVRSDFRRLRDGDRFYFERKGYFTPEEIRKIPSAARLAGPKWRLRGLMKSIIVKNTELTAREVRNPFFVL